MSIQILIVNTYIPAITLYKRRGYHLYKEVYIKKTFNKPKFISSNKVIMKTLRKTSKIWLTLAVTAAIGTTLIPTATQAASSKIYYPLQEISKLECRFKEFSTLGSECKQSLPKLKTKDYEKYAKQSGGYNDYTRLYTVLWWSSYKYGWDVWNGGHMWVDIATAQGTPVYAMTEWKVIIAKNLTAFGKNVSIQHTINGKTIVSNYAHLHNIDVKVWDKVKAWEKIGEVGSTGNSTWNHLHFQIDLPSSSYPAYYNYKSCPYSYYQITEDGVCFNQLKNITIDPLLFLETAGAVVDKIKTTSKTVANTSSNSSTKTSSNTYKGFDMSIFDRTVYTGYSTEDIITVQQIFRDLNEYSGPISGNYNDIENDIIAYQIANKVIENKNSVWAGWFGPKTRTQTKHDYKNFLKSWGKPNTTTSNKEYTVESSIETQKISRRNLLSREEIEAREVEEFMKDYNIELNFKDIGWNIEVGKQSTLKLRITDKKGKPFKWNMPWGMTFLYDEKALSIFPSKLYNFTDGKRNIIITGKKEGNPTIGIKIWSQTIERIPVKVYSWWKTIYPDSSTIISNKSIVLGEQKTGIVLFKDDNQKLINIQYGSTFTLKTKPDTLVCIKSGSLSNIRKIYKSSCNDSEFTSSPTFDYSDTVWGLLIYDYKVIWKDSGIEVINNYDNKSFDSQKLTVKNPKWLSTQYAYTNEIVSLLEDGIVDGINKWYFEENKELSKYDSIRWIIATLESKRDNPEYNQTQLSQNIATLEIFKNKISRVEKISRSEFLALSYEYIIQEKNPSISIEYRDLDGDIEKMANSVFDQNNTWKDRFGENYYQPEAKVTRWEAAYLLSRALYRNRQGYLVAN